MPASSLMAKIEVVDYEAYKRLKDASLSSDDARLALRDTFFCRYVWRLASKTIVEVGPAAQRMVRALACARRARGSKRSAAAWDGDVLSDSDDDAACGLRAVCVGAGDDPEEFGVLRRAAAALQLSAAPATLPRGARVALGPQEAAFPLRPREADEVT